jgi:hypothetical protein
MILLLANAYLGVFNLIPAFPMDGGRILRSLLSVSMTRERATAIASYIGRGIAVLLFALGMWRGQPTLALIGIFIFFAARQEYLVLVRQNRLKSLKAFDLMAPIEHLLFLGQSVQAARTAVLDRPENSFIVWSRPGIPAGYVTRERLFHNFPPPPPESAIDAWVVPAPIAIGRDYSAVQVAGVLQQHKAPLVLVTDGFGYIGTIDRERIERAFA